MRLSSRVSHACVRVRRRRTPSRCRVACCSRSLGLSLSLDVDDLLSGRRPGNRNRESLAFEHSWPLLRGGHAYPTGGAKPCLPGGEEGGRGRVDVETRRRERVSFSMRCMWRGLGFLRVRVCVHVMLKGRLFSVRVHAPDVAHTTGSWESCETVSAVGGHTYMTGCCSAWLIIRAP